MSSQLRTIQADPDVRIETFPVDAETDSTAGSAFASWFEAVSFGFHEGRLDSEDLPKLAEAYAADGRTLWGAYEDAPGPHSWDPRIPVATYGTMVNTLNVGGGRCIDAHLVTAVTVRPTHRRRGLLRRMITEDLRRAGERGLAVAALTASEATIYGRFGFGAATFTTTTEVDVRERFALTAPAYGRTEIVQPDAVAGLAQEIFAGFHGRSRGSIGRQFAYARRAAGLWSEERPQPDKGVRTAVHYDDGGRPDAYVAYKFAGWEATPPTVKVKDLVAVSDAAYLEIWRFLGSLDLVERVTYDAVPLQDPLPWALKDRRCRELKSDEDVLWLRVLDPVAALEARHYEADGDLTLAIVDGLGHAAGSYRITVRDGTGSVSRLDGATSTDARLDVAALGSLYLGGVDAATLASTGQIHTASAEALHGLDQLFRTARLPYCITHF